MSDITTLAGPSSQARIASSAPSSRKSMRRISAPAIGSTSWRSTPSTRPRAPWRSPAALVRVTATWHQPPGAQPRSMTRAPGSRKR